MFKHKLWCIERKEVERIVLNQKDMTFYGEHSIKKTTHTNVNRLAFVIIFIVVYLHRKQVFGAVPIEK